MQKRPEDGIPELFDREWVRPGEAADLLERGVHRKENRKEHEHRQTAAHRIDAALLVELHLLLLELRAVASVLLLDVVHRGRELLHGARRTDLSAEDREEREADGDRDDHDGEPEVVNEVIREHEEVDQRVDEERVPYLGDDRRHQPARRSGTGSYPPRLHGWHENSRLVASQPPRTTPDRSTASMAYSEQVGV